VLAVLAREGDTVKRGQVLATVQSREAMTLGAELAAAQGAYRVASAQAERDRQLLSEGIVPQARVQASDASRDAAAARLRELDAARRWAPAAPGGMGVYELRAPADGRIVERSLQPGSTADALAKAFVLVSAERVMLEVRVPASVAGEVRRGQDVQTRDGARARVTESAGVLDPASQTVLIRAEGEAAGLLPGAQTHVTLWLPAPPEVVSVPLAALQGEEGGERVYVRRGASFQAVKVSTLARDGDTRRLVRGGLKPGEQVATGALDALQAGAAAEGR
jgi:RND family efflux transporter MFP subunit